MTREQFEKEILPLSRNLYRFSFRFLPDREEAEDAVQDVLIKLWDMRDKLHTYRSVEAFSTTICRNLCLDRLKKKGRETGQPPEKEFEGSDNLLEELDINEKYSKTREVIETLPENYRTVIIMHDIDGYNYQDIADVMGQNVNMLRVTLSRARKMVREKIKQMYYEPGIIGKTS